MGGCQRVLVREHAIDWVRDVAHEDTATVLCGQGGVIPEVLGSIAQEDGHEIPDATLCKKGSFWALTFAGPRLHSAEYFPPLA